MADIDESKSRLVDFLRGAVDGNGGGFRQIDELRFELTTDSSASPIICTLDRDLVQEDESLVLMGIDHPITNRLSDQWRAAGPSVLGATATVGLDHPVVLSVWLVHSFGSGPDTGSHLLPIAVDREGKRVPTIEKQYRDCFKAPTGRPQFEQSKRITLLHEHIEPTLQRELVPLFISSRTLSSPSPRPSFKAGEGLLLQSSPQGEGVYTNFCAGGLGYRGIASPEKGYSTELLAWVEIA